MKKPTKSPSSFSLMSILSLLIVACSGYSSIFRSVSSPGSYGPAITFSGSGLTNYTLSYYTENPSADTLSLHFSNTNVDLTETVSIQYHRFQFNFYGNGTNFTYSIVSMDPAISNRSGNVPVSDPSHYRFVIYGDNRTQYDVHSRICSAISAKHPAFVLHTGDLVTDGSDPLEWPRFFNSAAPMLSNTVLIPAVGNHDNHNPVMTNILNPPLAGMYYYSLSFPGLKIVVLDTCTDYSTNSAQYIWLTNELATAGGRWKIALFHNAPYSSTAHRDDTDKPVLQNTLVPVMIRYGVNLVACGHDHLYKVSTNSNVVFLTTGGGGGPLHESVYPNPYRASLVTNTHHYVLADIVSNVMVLGVYDTNNFLLDSFAVTNTN